METLTIVYLFIISVIITSGLIFVLIKWHDEYNNRIAMEQEYDTLLERSIIICDELAKAEELVITQNKIIQELKDQLPEKCHVCGGNDSDLHECERCNELYCESCSSTYDQFSQIDYNCCESCANSKE